MKELDVATEETSKQMEKSTARNGPPANDGLLAAMGKMHFKQDSAAGKVNYDDMQLDPVYNNANDFGAQKNQNSTSDLMAGNSRKSRA